MKELEREVFVIASMATSTSVSPVPTNSSAQHPIFPTPSPFSFSVASTRWSSRPPFHFSGLFLRFLALLFSFVSALSLAAPHPKKEAPLPSSFTQFPEFMYCFIVSTVAFIYSAFQLFKGVCDIAHRGILISDMTSDYMSFIFDQLVGYLLISSSSVAIPKIQEMDKSASLFKAAIISISMSFTTFLIIGSCTLFSGYKLCKRIIW